MKIILNLTVLMIIVLITGACSDKTPDIVVIGTQTWTTKNLDVATFRNGDAIPEAKTSEEWQAANENSQPVWCYYENDVANGTKYGKLYNWYAVNDTRGLAPTGWHIPTDQEWTVLSTFLGGEDVAGEKMKSSLVWSENGNRNNISGFSGLPGGCRAGDFNNVGSLGYWWSALEDYKIGCASFRYLCHCYNLHTDDDTNQGCGFSVRCVRDGDKSLPKIVKEPKTPDVVVIGTQTWTTKNLDLATFRNGEAVPEAKTSKEWQAAGKNKQAAWCYYENDVANGTKYGKLYNWYAVSDKRGLAPAGWHVPTDQEWTVLSDFLGGNDTAGKKMKTNTGWLGNGNGTNSSGFLGLPGGVRLSLGDFGTSGNSGVWWSASESLETNAWFRGFNYLPSNLYRNELTKDYGFSVRLVKD